MKKKLEFRDYFESTASVLGWTLTWALMIFGWVAVGQPLTNAEAQGRVHMQLEDLKAVMALDSRNPTAVADREWNVSGHAQEELGTDSTFKLSMSQAESTRLAKKLSQMEASEEKQILAAHSEYEKAIAKIKTQRRELQMQRLNTATSNLDAESSKKIFENVLQEANLAALRDSKIEQIKETNLVTLNFVEMNEGAKVVSSIEAGKVTLWKVKNSAVALNQ